jgi:predicted RNase H-like HicB family nuclease
MLRDGRVKGDEQMETLANVLNQKCVHVRVWEDKDGGYISECLDIPGCMSQGESRNEALTNLMDAISVCLEIIAEDAGQPIPDHETEFIQLPIEQFLHAH